MHAALIQLVDNLIKPLEAEHALFGLKLRPAENADRHDVAFGLLHHGDIALNGARVVLPLLRVVVRAVQKGADLRT